MPNISRQDSEQASESASYAQLASMLAVARPPYALLSSALIVSTVEIASTLSFPLLTRNLIDASSSPSHAASATSSAGLLALILVLGAIASGISRYLLSKAGLAILGNLQILITEKLIRKDVAYFDGSMTGQHVSRVLNDTRAFSTLVTDGLSNLFAGLVVLAGSAVILLLLDIRLAATVFGILGVALLLMAPVGWLLSANAYRANEAAGRLGAILTQVFGEIRLVKAHSSEGVETKQITQEIRELQKHNLRNAKVTASFQPFVSLTACVAVIAILLYGGLRVQQGDLSVGTLTAFILYIFSVIAPLLQLTGFVGQLQVARGASVRALAILSMPDQQDVRYDYRAPIAVPEKAMLTFEDVLFFYPERSQPTLMLPALSIPAGSSTALIGPSGSGKSTLFALIERFYPVSSGAILYGGHDIESFSVEEWRLKIGYVAQTTPMVFGSIRNNIVYGLEHPISDSDIWAAASAANCADFISSLPEGLNSQIGEKGVRLSGGQKQRIAIARLFVRDPEILLLDEATSNLDGEAEHAVISAIQRLMKGRTNIIATHRLNTISSVDQIIVLEDGRVTAAGSHHELYADGGYYKRLSTRQNVGH